jgi:TPR repeat protein
VSRKMCPRACASPNWQRVRAAQRRSRLRHLVLRGTGRRKVHARALQHFKLAADQAEVPAQHDYANSLLNATGALRNDGTLRST